MLNFSKIVFQRFASPKAPGNHSPHYSNQAHGKKSAQSQPSSASTSSTNKILNKSFGATPAEVLKLPPSTYVRAVPAVSRQSPLHRFNVPVSI